MNDKEKMKWYELDYVDALRLGYERYKQEETTFIRTTAMIPQTMRIEIEQIGTRWNYTQRYIIFQLVYHGHAKLQHNSNDIIKEIEQRKSTMGHPKIGRVRDFLYDMHTTINGLKNPKQRAIFTTGAISSSLAKMANVLGIERASLIRLCMYYSIITLEDAAPEILTVAKQEIRKFEEYIEETEILYDGLILAETKWATMCIKAEVTDYPVENCAIAEPRKIYKKEGT
jgi:hypothetical protein